MKELLLITFSNKVYREKLELKGFQITDIPQPIGDEQLPEIAGFKGIAIIEIIEDSMQLLNNVIADLRKNPVRIIAITPKINDKFRYYFFQHGISEVMESNSADRIAGYLDITERNGNKKYGKLLILENNEQRINIFETIISRFNYTSIMTESVDKLFDNLTAVNIQLILINLGTRDFDLGYFLRKSVSSQVIKKIPVIPYKDIGEGLYIHEMISGLNKIARVILTCEELYSFLVDVLFRKELSPGLNLLNETLDYDNLKRFSGEPLSKIYNLLGMEIFALKKIIKKENINIIEGRIDSLKNLIIKVDGLKWLINDEINSLSAGGISHDVLNKS